MRRWLPGRALIVVADSGYPAIEWLVWCQRLPVPVTLITSLRLDATLYESAPARTTARKDVRASRADGCLPWPSFSPTWTPPGAGCGCIGTPAPGNDWKWPLILPCDTTAACPRVALGWVLVRDPKGRCEPQALLSTDPDLPASQIVSAFMRRWAMKVTFQEARAHLGGEGQRQWNDLAIPRATPLRLALFSLVTLLVQRQPNW